MIQSWMIQFLVIIIVHNNIKNNNNKINLYQIDKKYLISMKELKCLIKLGIIINNKKFHPIFKILNNTKIRNINIIKKLINSKFVKLEVKKPS
jgi:hypothetical protein